MQRAHRSGPSADIYRLFSFRSGAHTHASHSATDMLLTRRVARQQYAEISDAMIDGALRDPRKCTVLVPNEVRSEVHFQQRDD